jgi:Flp pilus assembly protein TadG
MIPLLAIFGTVIIGCMALAADLSLSTHLKRSLQNVTDAAALAGARQLPSTPVLNDEESATVSALQVIHNSFPWHVSGETWASNLAGSGCSGAQCSVTVCAGSSSSSPACSISTTQGSSSYPFVLTINVPPRTAAVAAFNGDPHRVEVVMHQQSGAFFSGIVGLSGGDGAQSVAYHFAPNQAFGFALFSRTVIQNGNAGETVAGNLYAGRYLAPQSSGQSGICAAPYTDGGGVQRQGYIYLGYPQLGNGSPPYQNDGQSTITHAPAIVGGVTCPTSGGTVGMSASPVSDTACASGDPGNNSGSALAWDQVDGACVANPPIEPPAVAAPPNIPVYPATVCGAQGLSAGVYQPGEYRCTGAGAASLVVDHPLAPGIYEVNPGTNTSGCDVTMAGTITQLSGVTFYLKAGAGICASIPSGVVIGQTPYNAGTGAAGDGRYVVLSDNAQNPSIALASGGGGSVSGTWSVTGVIWLPSGSVTIGNKVALEDQGQIVVNAWNDQGGYHQNASVTYNAALAPAQKEVLELSE